MNKKAIISVCSKQVDEDEEAVEVVTPGSFYSEGSSYIAVYDETEISGMEGTTTTLKIGKEEFSLIRTGSTSTKMNFKEKDKNVSLYNTPYGMLELTIETQKLNINVGDNGGDVLINYLISISGQKPQNTNLKINIKA